MAKLLPSLPTLTFDINSNIETPDLKLQSEVRTGSDGAKLVVGLSVPKGEGTRGNTTPRLFLVGVVHRARLHLSSVESTTWYDLMAATAPSQ